MSIAKNSLMKSKVRAFTLVMALGPIVYLISLAWQDRYGAEPLEALTKKLGSLTIWLFLLNLYIGLLLYFFKRPALAWLVQTRRPLGLITFAYACLHLIAFILRDGELGYALEQIQTKTYLWAGASAWAILLILSVTSNNYAIRKLTPKTWKLLHRTVYFILGLTAIHLVLIEKADINQAKIYFIPLVILQALRFAHFQRSRRSSIQSMR